MPCDTAKIKGELNKLNLCFLIQPQAFCYRYRKQTEVVVHDVGLYFVTVGIV